MARGNQREIPPELARGRDRFTAWRRTRRPKTRIPESLWGLAVRLEFTLRSPAARRRTRKSRMSPFLALAR